MSKFIPGSTPAPFNTRTAAAAKPTLTSTNTPGGYYSASGGNPWNVPEEVLSGEMGRKEYHKRQGGEYDQRKYQERRFNDYGYSLEARPYDFNESAFKNPYLEDNLKYINQQTQNYQNRDLGQIGQQYGQLDLNMANKSREEQVAILSQLRDQYGATARGEGNFVADAALRANTDRNIKQILAARAVGGGNPAASNRAALMSIGEMNQEAAQQGAMAKLQETYMARDALGNVANQYGQVRGLDVSQASEQQKAAFAVEQANQQARLQEAQMNDQMVQYFTNQGYTQQQAQWAAGMALEEQKAQQHQQAQGTNAGVGVAASGPSFGQQIAGSLISGAATLGAGAFMSDKRVKTNIKKGSKKDIGDFLESIKSYKFKYKDENYSPGDNYGVMAQDLEKNKIGKTLVMDTPQGKAINTAKGYGAVLQALSHLNERIKSIGEKGGQYAAA